MIVLMGLIGITAANCAKDKKINIEGTEPPEIKLIIDTLKPNLNTADNIPLVCVVFSDLGLKTVQLKIVRSSGIEDYKEYTSFKDPKQFSVKELPLWDDTFISFKIIATDLADRVTEKSIPISPIPYQAPPVIKFELEEVNIDENTIPIVIPTTRFTVKSEGVLTKVEVKLFRSAGVINVPLPLTLTPGTREYSFEDFIQYRDGDIALQVTATDEYNKVKIETLAIKYVQLPPPLITFAADSSFTTDVGSTVSVKLNISSQAGVASVLISKFKQNALIRNLSPDTFNGEKNLNFSANVTLEDNVSSLRVLVTDRLGRTSAVNMLCEVGFETRIFTLGSDFYNRGVAEEPGIYPFYSISQNRSMTIGEAYPKFKDIEMYVLWFRNQNGYTGDRGLRLMGPKNTVSLVPSDTYYTGGTYTWQGITYTTPSMFPASNWANRNQSTFIKIGATTNSATIAPFNFENVTISDLKNYTTNITGDRMPFLVEGDVCLIKLDAGASNVGFVGSKTGVASKICILKVVKIENETRPASVFTNPWTTAIDTRKIARVTFSLKIPK